MRSVYVKGIGIAFCLVLSYSLNAQITLSGQVRPRFEFRNSSGTLRPIAADPAFFISQRSRLNFNYKQSRVVFRMSVQDVRVWGQDASTISSSDGSRLGIHEAWADVILTNKKDGSFQKKSVDYFSIKTGRQEIEYDDGKLLGNHDWLQQARRHDAIVFKLENKGWKVDLGAAINRNDAFNFNGNFYTPANVPSVVKDSRGILVPTPANLLPLTAANGNSSRFGSPSVIIPASTNRLFQMYKSMEYLYVSQQKEESKFSFLFLADQFGTSTTDSVLTSNLNGLAGYVYGLKFNSTGTRGRFTSRVYSETPIGKKKNTKLKAGFAYQFGKDLNGKTISASMFDINVDHTINKHTIGAGLDYLSGNEPLDFTTNKKFDPLYGSPHEYWGYMDFFYANTGSPAGGLIDPHIKWQFTNESKRLTLGVKYHAFLLADNMVDINGKNIDRYLGSEIDLSWVYSLSKITTVEGGVSAIFATKSMEYAKGVTPNTTQLNGQWVFVQFNVKPEFILK